MKTNEEYIAKKGHHCPSCDHDDFDYKDIVIDETHATQEIFCLACGLTWTDCYELIGYTDPIEIDE